jgi:hypothetical protein
LSIHFDFKMTLLGINFRLFSPAASYAISDAVAATFSDVT